MAKQAKRAKQELVSIKLPIGTKYAQFVCVNGKGYNIPATGVSNVPIEIAEEFARSQRAIEATDAKSAQLKEELKPKIQVNGFQL